MPLPLSEQSIHFEQRAVTSFDEVTPHATVLPILRPEFSQIGLAGFLAAPPKRGMRVKARSALRAGWRWFGSPLEVHFRIIVWIRIRAPFRFREVPTRTVRVLADPAETFPRVATWVGAHGGPRLVDRLSLCATEAGMIHEIHRITAD